MRKPKGPLIPSATNSPRRPETRATTTACGSFPPTMTAPKAAGRPGLAIGCTLSCYVRLIDWTSRLIRAGKTHLDDATASLFQRLRLEPETYEAILAQLRSSKRTGTHFGTPARRSEVAQAHGRQWHRTASGPPPVPLALSL